jgi:Flp pilus assembly protein protease CpaA
VVPSIANLITGAALAALLIFAAITDVKTMNIPDWFWIGVMALAIPRVLWSGLSGLSAFIGLLITGLTLFIVTCFKKGAFGGGDIKLTAAVGFFLGLNGAPTFLFISCLLFYATAHVMQKKGKIKPGDISAFAPSIAVGAIITFTVMLLGG